mmetsp:Transcript_25776/g.46497  ORF Transcript_25776/g.46497 Transcript_25776/m.46497 type:complete len:338 (-) Transcript_25776:140-1153(-)
MYERPHQVIQLVQNTINHLDQQMSLLILQSWTHQQWQNLMKQRTCPKAPCLVRNLPHGRLALRRRPALDLQQQRHNAPLLRLLLGHIILLRILHEPPEILHVLRPNVRQRPRLPRRPGRLLRGRPDGHPVRLPNVLHRLPLPLLRGNLHLKSRGGLSPEGGGGAEQFTAGGADGEIRGRRGEEGVPLAGEDGVEGGVGPGTVAAFHLAFVGEGLGEVAGEEGGLASEEGSLAGQGGGAGQLLHHGGGGGGIPSGALASSVGCHGGGAANEGSGGNLSRCYQGSFIPFLTDIDQRGGVWSSIGTGGDHGSFVPALATACRGGGSCSRAVLVPTRFAGK